MSGDMLPISAAVLTVGMIRLLSSQVKVAVYEGLCLQVSLTNQSAQAGDSSHESRNSSGHSAGLQCRFEHSHPPVGPTDCRACRLMAELPLAAHHVIVDLLVSRAAAVEI